MDTLSHLIFSLAGGYMLKKGLMLDSSNLSIFLLALASVSIDVDHSLTFLGLTDTFLLHNLLMVAVFTIITFIAFGGEKALLISTMLYGHMLMDMNTGIYGIPLIYPLSSREFIIPPAWEIVLLGDTRNPVVSRTGISLTLYFGLIGLLIAQYKIRKKRRQAS